MSASDELVYNFEKMGSTMFKIGGDGGEEGILYRTSEIKKLEVVSRKSAIRSFWVNGTYEGSRSKRTCSCWEICFENGEYISEIILRIPWKRAKGKVQIFIHYIEIITNYKRRALGGSYRIDKHSSQTVKIVGRVSSLQTFFKNTGGTLLAINVQLSNPLEERDISREEEERLIFVVENLSDYTVKLANKDLSLWKSLVLRRDCKVNEERLRELSLDVDEYTILCFFLGKKKMKVDSSSLLDYYFFFYFCGLKYEMCVVLELLEMIDDFESLYRIFLMCLPYEPKISEEWFKSSDDEDTKSLEFETAFSAKVFNLLKSRRQNGDVIPKDAFSKDNDEIGGKLPVVVDEKMGILLKMMNHKSTMELIQGHKDIDFGDNDSDEAVYIRKKRRLFERHYIDLFRGRNSNVVLITSDGEETECHLELLITSFEFFMRMVQFGGSEFTDWKEKGTITLVGLKKDELKVLLNYCYLRRIEAAGSDIGVLISVFAHCEKYTEFEVLDNLIEEIKGKVKASAAKRQDMESILYRNCKVLEMEHMRERLLPILTTSGFAEKELLRMLEKEARIRALEERVAELELETGTKELEDRAARLERKCKRLKKKNRKLKKLLDE